MAPLKNYKSLNAVMGKADAVYFGVESFNMRMFSDNFKLDELNKIVRICHDNPMNAYLTTNIIIYENEIELLDSILDKAIEADIDAFKIEGRMRDPIYIEEATACYREAIDAYY